MTVLRPARTTDAGAVGGILTEFAQTTDWMPKLHTGAEDIAHAGVLIERGWVTVAVQAGEVLGFAACNGSDLDALYVRHKARNQGIGTALLNHLQTQENALELWTFQANTGAQRFYELHGFVERTRSDGSSNDEKLPDIQYHWQRKAKG